MLAYLTAFRRYQQILMTDWELLLKEFEITSNANVRNDLLVSNNALLPLNACEKKETQIRR